MFYRSEDGLTNFEQGPTLFPDNMRHTALDVEGDDLKVFYTNASDSPERILLSTIDLSEDWSKWKASEPVLVLEPETEYEGAELPAAPSSRGLVMEKVRQLRDPAIFRRAAIHTCSIRSPVSRESQSPGWKVTRPPAGSMPLSLRRTNTAVAKT